LQDLKRGQFEDESFDDFYFINSTKEWSEWINLKGVMINGPMMDEQLQRSETPAYAEQMKLVTSVQAWMMQFPGNWCNYTIENDMPWLKLAACSVYDSYATGNPLYPLFDLRNIDQECNGWFDCYQNNALTNMAMNQADILEVLGANLTYTNESNWMWSDCNTMDSYQVKTKFNKERYKNVDDDQMESRLIENFTKPSEVFSKILDEA